MRAMTGVNDNSRQEKRILIGQIAGVHGVRGLVRVRSFAAEPEDIFAYRPLTDETGEKIFALTLKGMQKDQFLAQLDGVASREAAEALRGQRLYVARRFLPPPKKGEYYLSDLVDLEARLEDGAHFGRVVALHNFGAGDILEVQPAALPGDGKKAESIFLPFRDAFFPDVNVEDGFVTLRLPAEI